MVRYKIILHQSPAFFAAILFYKLGMKTGIMAFAFVYNRMTIVLAVVFAVMFYYCLYYYFLSLYVYNYSLIIHML